MAMATELGQFLAGAQADSLEEGDDLRSQACRQFVLGGRSPKDVAQFGLHAAAVPGRALLQALLHTGIDVPDEDLGHDSSFRYHDSV